MTTKAILQSVRLDAIRALGVVVDHEESWVGEVGTPQRHPEPILDAVRSIELPFTSDEWCSIAMREARDYVGGCCGNMSALQDYINEAFRDSGTVSNSDLMSMAELARDHEGFECFQPMDDTAFSTAIASWDEGTLGPWDKLGVIFNALEPALKPDYLTVPNLKDLSGDNELSQTVRKLGNTLRGISWLDLFTRDESELAQHQANRTVNLAKTLPLVRNLLAALEAEDSRFEGVAVVSGEDRTLLSNSYGLCLFPSREEADRVIQLWLRSQPELEGKIDIVDATVTVKDGLVLRDR